MTADKYAGCSATYTLRASTVARIHTILSFGAFGTALLVGCALHYKKIVKNGVAGWPQEWFPSVSATIGDWYPERNIFQILIALTSGPRFAVIFLSYFLNHAKAPSSSLPAFALATGIIRTLSCGGWVYITSSDDHDVHDVLMILYIVCNIPWMYGGIKAAGTKTRKRRMAIAAAFWTALVPMIYFFAQHKVHRIPGAYTHYSFFEWSLILLDVLFDATTELEFRESGVEVTIALPQSGSAERMDEEIKKSVTSVKTGGAPTKSLNGDSTKPGSTKNEQVNVTANSSILSKSRPTLSFLADVYFAYQTWTLLTALPTTLFYFSVWKLALAGPEFSSLATLAPLFLASPHILSFSRARYGRAILSAVGAVAGIGLWKAESVWTRLGGVVVGVMAGLMRWGAEWEEGGAYHGIVFIMGLMVSSLSKHLNHSNNPAWPIVDEKSGGYHIPILGLSFLAILELTTRPSTSPSPPSLSTCDEIEGQGSATPSKSSSETTAPPTPTPSSTPWLSSSVALGALLYSLHERLSDASTLIAWSWTGYPLSGPSPHAHEPLTLIAQSLGVLIAILALPSTDDSLSTTEFLQHPVWYAIGATSSYVLYAYKNWVGYSGALVHAVFLTSITPYVLRNVAVATRGKDGMRGKRVGRVLTTAWAVWIVFLFTGTFTVAYAFVPGAGPFREHTDYVLAAQILLLTPTFRWRSIFQPGSITHSRLPRFASSLPSSFRTHTLSFLAIIPLIALLSPLTHAPSPPPAPSAAHARGRLLNAGIWTVHFGMDDAGRDSQRRMRDLVKDMELDVFGLLETDLYRPVFGNRDLTRVISEELGYYVDIGPGPNHHTWGAALFSKFPILKSTHHLLPSPYGELAPAIEAILDIYGVNVTVVVAHNGQEETPLDRELQATELARIMAASHPDPVIFLGYVVTKPKAARPAPYLIMTQDGLVHDIDGEDSDRWCEYIMYRGLYRTAYARVSRSTITDTELQIGQFVVPRYGKPVTNDTHEARYLRSWKEDLPKEHWFPMEYYGNDRKGGVRGHFYHVFNTPLYYQLPEGAEV